MTITLWPVGTCILAFCALALAAQSADSSAPRPNILIFITDDESWQERAIYGWANLPTPNFDRLAREGVLFTRGYTSAPSCAPSRAALLTGRNFWELEQGAFIQAWLPKKFAVLPDLMEAAGYHVGYTGKGWGPGVTDPQESGRPRNPAGPAFNDIKLKDTEKGFSNIDYIANFNRFLSQTRDRPFLFWLGSIEPHSPCSPENYKKLELETGIATAKVKVPEFLPNTPGVRRSRANMQYEVCRADANLGKALELLKTNGLLENTLVIATADNGTQVLRSKANLYDWGIHVPMAMMWLARVKPGRVVDDFVNFIDLAPTVLDAAGLPVPSEMSGRSMASLLFSAASGRIDPARSWTAAGLEWHGERDPINLAGRTIRNERYHYIVNYGDGPRRAAPKKVLPDSEYEMTAEDGDEIDLVARHPSHPQVRRYTEMFVSPRPAEELFDCLNDPWQLKNLAGSPQHQSIKQELRRKLEEYQRKTNDPRITGNLELFKKTREYVLERKYGEDGYANQ